MSDDYQVDAQKELIEYMYTLKIIYGAAGKRFSIEDAELMSLSRFDVARDLEGVVKYLRE